MIELFNSLTKDELNRFEDFVNSPYFNKYKTLIKLFNYLKEKYPAVKKEDINKKVISMSVYSKVKIRDETIRKLISDFSILLDQFLIQSEIENYPFDKRIQLIRAVKKKKIVKKWGKLIDEINNKPDKKFSKDEEFYLNQIDLSGELYEYNIFFKNFSLNFLYTKIENINYYFLYMHLGTVLTFLVNYRNKKQELYDRNIFVHEIILFIEKNKDQLSKYNPSIVMFYYFVLMYMYYDDKYYKDLLQFFSLNEGKFDSKAQMFFNICCELYFHKKILHKIGDEQSNRKKLLQFDKSAHVKGRHFDKYYGGGLFIDGYKFIFTLKNALSLSDIKWAQNFLNKRNVHIQPNERKDIINICSAVLNFFKKDYSNVLKYLIDVPYNVNMYYTEIKILKLLMWIESNDITLFQHELQSFKKTLPKLKNMSETIRKSVSAQIEYLMKILKLQNTTKSLTKIEINSLRKELDNEKLFFDYKFWMYDKLKEIENSL